MVEIDGVLISDSIFEEQFICDLKQCRGACCVEGEEGAPLKKEEASIAPIQFNCCPRRIDRNSEEKSRMKPSPGQS